MSRLILAGHEPVEGPYGALDALEARDCVSGWLNQVRNAIDKELAAPGPTYIVGFSFGASLALKVASEREVDGVLCISMFCRPRRRIGAKIATWFPSFPPVGSRRPRVTENSSRKYLRWAPQIPSEILREVICAGPELSSIPRNRRVLLVHSTDDPVADYRAVVAEVKKAASAKVRLVTFAGLEHFIQFDMSPHAMCEVALAHFDPLAKNMDSSHPAWTENLKQREEEVRHWSNAVWLVLAGFLAFFGILLNLTLSDVFRGTERAPYYLVAYSMLITFYLQQLLLYLFYLNRTQAYLRLYVEPVGPTPIGFAEYRTNRWISTRQSRLMTPFVSFAASAIPVLLSVWSLVSVVTGYRKFLFSSQPSSVLLQVLVLVGAIWLLIVLFASRQVGKYTNLYLRLVPSVLPGSSRFVEAIVLLYASVHPASANPPERRGDAPGSGSGSTSAGGLA